MQQQQPLQLQHRLPTHLSDTHPANLTGLTLLHRLQPL
jgi:hypothetical protein